MNLIELFEQFERRRRPLSVLAAFIILLLLVGVVLLVYFTGGIKFVYSHSMYLPILLAGMLFGVWGGVLIGVLAGLVLGPWMPIDVQAGEMQPLQNWVYRLGFFTLIGFFAGVFSDLSRAYLRHLRWLTRHDSASGLANREALIRELSAEFAERSGSDHFLLLVAFENTREMKSVFGQGVTDVAVSQLAQKLSINADHQQIYRIAPAQLAFLLHAQGPAFIDLLKAMVQQSREPIIYNNISIHLDTRIGYVRLNDVDMSAEMSLQSAESALVMAQQKARDYMGFRPEILTRVRDNLILLGELKEALEQGQLTLHYQPKIDLHTGQVCGVEALMRWHHPVRGLIAPGDFIPRAEQSTLINQVTDFVLNQVMQTQRQWLQQGVSVPVAVNVSTRNLLQPNFADRVFALLEHYQLDARLLELEVTEGALMLDMERTLRELSRLDELNIILSIDDFGTGYSSLQYLHRLPVSLLKIDQTFVHQLPDDAGARYILEAAIGLAHKMGIKALAEGVET